jgi:hypothetical protein
LDVKKAAPAFDCTPETIEFGTRLTLTRLHATHTATTDNGTATLPGEIQCDQIGRILDAGTYELELTFRPTDNTNYKNVTIKKKVTVNPAPVPIIWTPNPIEWGRPLTGQHLNATFKEDKRPIKGKPFYHPGKNDTLNVGPQQLSVRFIPAQEEKNYRQTDLTIQITVLSRNPVIAWADPAEISQGTSLAAVLNAQETTGAAGNMTYSHQGHHVLALGNAQALVATFTPTDATKYTTATKTVYINVVKVTAAEKDAIMTNQLQLKILRGKITKNGDLAGAHSRNIIGDPNYQVVHLPPNNANGTENYNVRKKKPDNTWTPAKQSTLPPNGWDDDDFMRATVQTASAPIAAHQPKNRTLHRAVIDGVNWEVVKNAAGKVISSYPTA